MTITTHNPTFKLYFEYWPVIWLWPISLILMQLTFYHLADFEITVGVVICHLIELYIVMFYWLNRPSDGQVVVALAVIVYSLSLGLFAQDPAEFGRSLAQVVNLVVMVMICLNAPLARRPEIRRSIGVFCVLAVGAGLFIIAQALCFNLLRDLRLANILGPLAPLGPGNAIYDVTAYAPPPRANGFYSEPSVAGWFMTFAVAVALAARRLYPVLTTLTATICALAAMATLSLTGVLGASIVLVGYVLFVRDRLGYKLFWLALAGSGVTIALYYAQRLGILARFHDLDQPGTSLYFRLTAPYTLISDTLHRFPIGYPLGQTDFIASRKYFVNWPAGSQTNIDNTLFKIVFYFGLLGVLFNATYAVQLARYLLLKRHAVGLLILSLLISLSTTGAGWAHHFVLMIGYAIIVGRYLRAQRLVAPTLTRAQLAAFHSAAVRRVAGTRNAASSSASRALAVRRWRALTWP
jgi:putative colanic acid polymerase